jgi:PhoPQ-activated pathogenicity-related protein
MHICDEPNQPLFGLRGNQLLFYTLGKFVETSEEDWPLLFPMVKSVVASINATQQYLETRHVSMEKFFMFGISKLGWVTYLTAAIDPRIFAIVPMAYDNLNFQKQLEHRMENWGANDESVSSDVDLAFSQAWNLLNSEKGRRLVRIVDPYSYIERLTMPKLIVEGTNDELWPVDAGWLYFHDLPGKNYTFYLPNKKHKIEYELSIINTMLAFFKSSSKNEELVDFQWKYSNESLFITARPFPISTTGWMAKSKTLDFRNSHWTRIPAKTIDRKYVVSTKPLDDMNTCYLGEMIFEKYGITFKLTSLPKIIKKK